MEGFSGPKEIYWTAESPHRKQNLIQEGTNMKKGRKINRVRCDIQSHEYGWSDSDSNFSAKLSDQTLRYREALELANVLGYEIVWQKRRED